MLGWSITRIGDFWKVRSQLDVYWAYLIKRSHGGKFFANRIIEVSAQSPLYYRFWTVE